jgi:hypothetical protein
MQPNKTKLALKLGAVVLGAASASYVSADPFTMTVNTIGDLSITTNQPLAFGTALLTDALSACSMGALVPAPADVFSDDSTGTAGTSLGTSGTAFGLLNGDGCIGAGATIATPGIYTIIGEPTLDVNLTLNAEPQVGNFTFSPTGGCGVDHDQIGATAAGDPCQPITPGSPITLTLAGGSDAILAQYGNTHFTVGGTVTVGAAPGLDSGTDYNATFLVNVIY